VLTGRSGSQFRRRGFDGPGRDPHVQIEAGRGVLQISLVLEHDDARHL
jgi:hypothetical protein